MIRFILNDKLIETELPSGSTVLDFVRYHKRLTGTKIGCREGDCGACTILVGNFEKDKLVYRSHDELPDAAWQRTWEAYCFGGRDKHGSVISCSTGDGGYQRNTVRILYHWLCNVTHRVCVEKKC